jgi:hypothetical protein
MTTHVKLQACELSQVTQRCTGWHKLGYPSDGVSIWLEQLQSVQGS